MKSSVEAIYIAPRKGDPVSSVRNAVVIAGTGLRGDRYTIVGKPIPGRHITMIETEEIERFNAEYHREVGANQIRRNIVTRGVRLTELVGQIFYVGNVRLRGVELCEPCAVLGRNLATPAMAPKHIVRAWVRRAGLCAETLDGGTIAVGDLIRIDAR